jgi:hypothetical protein
MDSTKLHFQRFEFKYYLPKNIADKLIPALLHYMEWDPYVKKSGRDFYLVNSLYFDTENYDCFWDKEAGVSKRKKLRLRFYGDLSDPDSEVFLEIKRKNNAIVTKDRIKLPLKNCLDGNWDGIIKQLHLGDKDSKFLSELLMFKLKNGLRPKIFINYRRKALIGKKDARFRVTFDYDIATKLSKSLLNNKNGFTPVYPEGVVLELKYNNILPVWFHGIIERYQLDRVAYSKYCNALRSTVPELDDNNYSLN